MAYNGYLIEIAGKRVPSAFIKAGSYKPKINTQDVESYRDANGKLNRTVLDHAPNSVEWIIIPQNNSDRQKFFSILRDAFGFNSERKANCKIYVPYMDDYYQGDFYMPDFDSPIDDIDEDTVYYSEARFALIEY